MGEDKKIMVVDDESQITRVLRRSFRPAAVLCGFFLISDTAFFGANIIKFFDGG
ncbi:MAG: hypothetical protein ACR2F2_08230 [Pyrinomonadaceae bacterium]